MDVKDPQAVHSEAVSNSDIDDAEKAGRASVTVGNHKENLADLDDPDAGKTAEERAAIVSDATHFWSLYMRSNSFAGQEAREENRFLADPVALFALLAQFPW
jgi:hypothetical protein